MQSGPMVQTASALGQGASSMQAAGVPVTGTATGSGASGSHRRVLVPSIVEGFDEAANAYSSARSPAYGHMY